MEFAHPAWLFAIALLPVPFLLMRRKGSLFISRLSLLNGVKGLTWLQYVPEALLAASLALVLVALARPQQVEVHGSKIIYSRAILIATDVSHSMTDPFTGHLDDLLPKQEEIPQELSWQGQFTQAARTSVLSNKTTKLRKIDAAQAAIMRFVLNRYKRAYGDRIGLIVFDMEARLSWPLTTDLKQVFRNGAFLSQEALNGGTNFGEQPNGPFDLAAKHFDEYDHSASKVFVLMTDGEAQLSEATQQRLYKLVSTRKIHLYLVGIGPELLSEDLEIARFTKERCHGHILHAENGREFARCFDDIDRMERTAIEVPAQYSRRELYGIFAGAALACLFLTLLARLIFVRLN